MAFYGTDYDRVLFRTQGETTNSARRIESAEFQLLYSRLVGYYWDVRAGVRFNPGLLGRPNRTYGVAAIQGLAPGFFEVNGQVFVSETGAVSFRAESSYDIYITQRLVLQPEVEINLAVQRDREIEAGAGFSDVEFGLRLRYEFTREVAPYIGINYERSFGDTACFRRAEGEAASSLPGAPPHACDDKTFLPPRPGRRAGGMTADRSLACGFSHQSVLAPAAGGCSLRLRTGRSRPVVTSPAIAFAEGTPSTASSTSASSCCQD